MNCGPITYEQRCVNGACFQFPRQHCVPVRFYQSSLRISDANRSRR